MKTTTWAIFGSLIINLMLGLAIAAVFSVPPVKAAEPAQCAAQAAARAHQAPAPSRPAHRYIIAVRMGWAMG